MSNLHDYKYQNITISGLPGGGSTTLLKLLKDELKLDGWRGFSGGEFMRAYALEKGLFRQDSGIHHDSRHYEDDFDRQIDYGMREKVSQEEKWIIESWLSGFMAQEVSGVLKVLVYCSDDSVRVDRIVNRDKVTVQKAKQNMLDRYYANLSKWSRMYKQEWNKWVVSKEKATQDEIINFWKENLYDLVIDTYSMNQQETLQQVLKALEKPKN